MTDELKEIAEEWLENNAIESYKDGFYELFELWHDCFLSCPTSYCATQFREVKIQGELGNMTKGE